MWVKGRHSSDTKKSEPQAARLFLQMVCSRKIACVNARKRVLPPWLAQAGAQGSTQLRVYCFTIRFVLKYEPLNASVVRIIRAHFSGASR